MSESPDQKLTEFLTDIDPSKIDTATEFSTPQALACQIADRISGNIFGIRYYRERADLVAECMRSWWRGSRQEAVLAKYQDKGMFDKMVGIASNQTSPINNGERK